MPEPEFQVFRKRPEGFNEVRLTKRKWWQFWKPKGGTRKEVKVWRAPPAED